MKRLPWSGVLAVWTALLGMLPSSATAADWPQWRGENGDGISTETGLLSSWTEGGPQELWRVKLGCGYSAVSVVGGRAYTMYGTESDEMTVCLDTSDGNVVWQVRSGPLFEHVYGNGPRATPTLDEGHVYTYGAEGTLLCCDAASGDKQWGFNTVEKFATENLEYGQSACPAVFGDMLVVVVGGRQGNSLAALNKNSGAVLWTSLNDKGGYATPIRAVVDGLAQIVVLTGEAIVGVAEDDGRELWRHAWITNEDANVATPIFHDGKLFVSSGYGTGCALFELRAAGGSATATRLWANKRMKNYFSTSVLVGGHLYGFNSTMLACLDWETGDSLWRQRGFNRGSLIAADGKLIVYGERATLALAEASPDKYKELAQAPVLDGKTWTVPTIAGGKLYVRNEQELVCLKMVP